jgi:hypothetical protein
MWDGDGFFEIHPRTGQDVQHQSCGDVQAAKKVRSRDNPYCPRNVSCLSSFKKRPNFAANSHKNTRDG